MEFRRYYNLRINFFRGEKDFIIEKLKSEFGKRMSFLETKSTYLEADLWEEFNEDIIEKADQISCDRAKKIEEKIEEIFRGNFQEEIKKVIEGSFQFVEVKYLTIFEKEGGNTFTHRIGKWLR